MARSMAGAANPNWRGAGLKECQQCRCSFFDRCHNKRRRFCSMACRNVAQLPQLRAQAQALRKPLPRCKLCNAEVPRSRRLCEACTPAVKPIGRYLCCGTSTSVKRDLKWCQLCRAAGLHRVPGPMSTCHECGDVFQGYQRKYCDWCWRLVMGKRRGMPRRVDANQSEIVQALRQVGCCVEDMSAAGGGFPDLLVWSPRLQATLLLEVKIPKGKLNKLQQKWHAEWRGHVCVVQTVDDALRVVGAIQ